MSPGETARVLTAHEWHPISTTHVRCPSCHKEHRIETLKRGGRMTHNQGCRFEILKVLALTAAALNEQSRHVTTHTLTLTLTEAETAKWEANLHAYRPKKRLEANRLAGEFPTYIEIRSFRGEVLDSWDYFPYQKGEN
jgi:hypothetical protein